MHRSGAGVNASDQPEDAASEQEDERVSREQIEVQDMSLLYLHCTTGQFSNKALQDIRDSPRNIILLEHSGMDQWAPRLAIRLLLAPQAWADPSQACGASSLSLLSRHRHVSAPCLKTAHTQKKWKAEDLRLRRIEMLKQDGGKGSVQQSCPSMCCTDNMLFLPNMSKA